MAGILCNRPYLRLESCIWKYELLCINCWLFMFYVLDDKLSCMFTLCHFVLDNTYYLFFALIFVTSICWVITVYYKPFSIMSYLLKLFFFLFVFILVIFTVFMLKQLSKHCSAYKYYKDNFLYRCRHLFCWNYCKNVNNCHILNYSKLNR